MAGKQRSAADRASKSEFVVVANRLPVDRTTGKDGKSEWTRSPGGLVSALEPLMRQRHGAWLGWSGSTDDAPAPFENEGLQLHPIALTATEIADYYEGFSNATLWPLYHDAVVPAEFHRRWWNAYVKVNQRFADAAAEVAAEGAFVWVHDYQLQLVPAMLRQQRPDLKIGFFLHIPFPPTELFSQIPWRNAIMEGLLGADLIGFQLPGGAANFMRLARALLGLKPQGLAVEVDGRTVRAQAFPISIDSKRMAELARSPEVQERSRQILADLGHPKKVILGIDRLDYTKGIAIRLEAFEELLEDGRISVPDAVMVQVATPSRERVEQYRMIREDIERRVGRINGEHGTVGVAAIHYIHRSLPAEELVALYLIADVMAVTPIRDGMNLVAKEYVSARIDGTGALVLSEFAGAAAELKQAFLVNPHNINAVKLALMAGLTVTTDEAKRRMRQMQRHVHRNDVNHWAESFVEAMSARPRRSP